MSSKVVVTGGAGFLGQLLVQEIVSRGRLEYETEKDDVSSSADGNEGATSSPALSPSSCHVAAGDVLVLDTRVPPVEQQQPGVQYVAVDISDSAALSRYITTNTKSIFHMAAVLSGEAEREYDLGMKINLDATRSLVQLCRLLGHCPCLIMPSSVAVFGAPSCRPSSSTAPPSFSEDTAPRPLSSYGCEKAMSELLIADATRRGFIRGRAVRLPTIIVRPGRPNSATSSFCSSIVREPLAGESAVCPVDPALPLWVQSPATVVANILHAHDVNLNSACPIITLPGLTTTPQEMVQAMAEAGGNPNLVEWKEDPFIQSIVATWPGHIATPTALALGFKRDADVRSIVDQYVQSTLQISTS